ncbi:MAG: tyrosine-type recombinase/integrase [Thermoguttaceae bacterium]
MVGWTGFRRKELASLTRRSFDLDGTPPNVKVMARYSKNKRTDSIPLHPVVVEWFREWLESKPGLGFDEPLFPLRSPGGSWRKTHKMMATDLKAAGLPYKDEAGLFADFHSNRHTFISNLGRAGVHITMAQKLARHSTPSLTANVYTHLGLEDKADAIASLPAPEMPAAFSMNGSSEKDLGPKTVAPWLRKPSDNGAQTMTNGDNSPRLAVSLNPLQHVNTVEVETHDDKRGQMGGEGLEPPTFGV